MPELQAARGASLIASETSGDPTTGASPGDRPRRLSAPALAFTVALVGLVVDQVSKTLAVRELAGQPPVEVIGSFLQLRLLRNPGAAFSTGTAFTEVLTGVAIVAVGVVLWLSRRVGSTVWAVALGLLLAGVSGNLTDRMLREPGPFRGHVIDFLMLPNWPIFNVADMCINVAAGLILVQAFRGIKLDGSRVPTEGPADD